MNALGEILHAGNRSLHALGGILRAENDPLHALGEILRAGNGFLLALETFLNIIIFEMRIYYFQLKVTSTSS